MLFNALSKTKKGMVTCVFETTDSISHMFWRYLDKTHPALKAGPAALSAKVIEDLFVQMDEMIGRVRAAMSPKSALFIMSDHGFKPFRRGVNLNTWLLQNGYLALKDGADGDAEWFKDVDWSRTRAYALGLGGVYVNQKGREAQGIVPAGEEAKALRLELAEEAHRPGRRGGRRGLHQTGLRPRRDLPRPLPGQRPRPHYRLQRGLAGVLGRRHRPHHPGRLRRQRQVLERRPLHRPVLRAGGPVLQPQAERAGPLHHGRGPHRARALRPGAARAHGRKNAAAENRGADRSGLATQNRI